MPASPLLALAGVALIGLAVTETVSTALRVDRRGGLVTRWTTTLLWRGFSGGGTRRRSGPPLSTGVAVTVGMVLTWGALALAGWFLLFSSDPGAVVDATTGEPADAWSRLYFAGYTLSTVGLGDYVPSGAPWQVVTVAAGGFGFGMATLVITYLAGVVSAVTAKRQLARTIWGLGETPQQIVERAWDGEGFTLIGDQLRSITPALQGVAEQHRAYPLISYFAASRRHTADVPAVALLHDTVVLLTSVEDERRPAELVTSPTLAAIDAFLEALPGAAADPEEVDLPPWPEVEGLQATGIPVRPLSELPASDRALRRRRRLGAVMHHQGWGWRDLEEASDDRR